MNYQNKKETAIQNEQQLCNSDKVLLDIKIYLKSIAKSLEILANFGIRSDHTSYYRRTKESEELLGELFGDE